MVDEERPLSSARPYLLRGFYEWIVDNGLTPHILVDACHEGVMVPPDSVVNNQIVLNISTAAVQRLTLDNEAVQFGARFAGVHWEICVPIDAVMAIYARENGRGITFGDDEPGLGNSSSLSSTTDEQASGKGRGKPELKLVT